MGIQLRRGWGTSDDPAGDREYEAAFEAHLTALNTDARARRAGSDPELLLHAEGELIAGNVLMFHGFSGAPAQMHALATYLYRNGFNVYSVNLAGQAHSPADDSWLRVQLTDEYESKLRSALTKAGEVPALVSTVDAILDGEPLDPGEVARSIDLLASTMQGELDPKALDALWVTDKEDLSAEGEAEFARATRSEPGYAQDYKRYLADGLDRLAEIDPAMGPVFTVGLSVGGAVALAVAEESARVEGVVAYAPFLKVESSGGDLKLRAINMIGPLDLQHFAWEPDNPFPWGALTAANRFGHFVRTTEQSDKLTDKPTLMILTENEDAADVATSNAFFASIGGEGETHRLYSFTKDQRVPHPMVPVCTVSQEMVNHYWRPMYQETLRFLTRGTIDPQNLTLRDQDGDPAMPAGFEDPLCANVE